MTITYYKIVDKQDASKFYIGSTTQTLRQRIQQHQHSYKLFQERLLYEYISKKDNEFNDFNIISLAEEEGETHLQRQREQEYINLFKPCLNTYRAYISPEDAHKLKLIYFKERCHRTIVCECGAKIRANGIWRHKKTNKHQLWMLKSKLQENIILS